MGTPSRLAFAQIKTSRRTLEHVVDVVLKVVDAGHVVQVARVIAVPVLRHDDLGRVEALFNPVEQTA